MSDGSFFISSIDDQYIFLVPIAPDSCAVRFIVSRGYSKSDSKRPVTIDAPTRC